MTLDSPGRPGRSDARRHVIPPAVQARRMQRYSIQLILLAFMLVAANYQALSLESVLWFAAGITAGFSVLCAVCVVILNGLAWNFDRMRDELQGGRQATQVGLKDQKSPRPSWHGLQETTPELEIEQIADLA